MGLVSLLLHPSKNSVICFMHVSLVIWRSLTVLNSSWSALTSRIVFSMLTKSCVIPERKLPFLKPRPFLLDIPMCSGGSQAPESSNQTGCLAVGFHSYHLSSRPTFSPCLIAEPAKLDMLLKRNIIILGDANDTLEASCRKKTLM